MTDRRDRTTDRPPSLLPSSSGRRRRISGTHHTSALVGEALAGIEQLLDEELSRRFARVAEELRDPLRLALTREATESYEIGKEQGLRLAREVVLAYLAGAHRAYADAVHAVRPGLEVPAPAVPVAAVAAWLREHAELEVTDEDAAELCRKLRLPLAEDDDGSG